MHRGDIPFAVRLANQEGWGIPVRDFERILHLNPAEALVAQLGTRRVGIATATSYGRKIAWIGNVVVKREFRGRHVGKELVERLLKQLSAKRVKHVALYSFKENFQFYERLGFVYGPKFFRLRRERRRPLQGLPDTSMRNPMTFSSLLAMDTRAFGADRGRLLKLIIHPGYAWYESYRTGSSGSYIVVKNYADMYELGPWVSFGLGAPELDSLLRMVLEKAVGKPIEVSCPASQRALEILKKEKFDEVNQGSVLFHERLGTIGRPEGVVAYGFLDKG
jgi:ribosomal protein S18 acetylase RimI-like enzyme